MEVCGVDSAECIDCAICVCPELVGEVYAQRVALLDPDCRVIVGPGS